MINIGLIPFIIIIQILVFFIILSAFLLFLLRVKNKEISKLKTVQKEHDEVSPGSSVEHYFKTEMKLTQARFDMFYKPEDLGGNDIAEPDWLFLRKNYLEMEKEFLSSSEREDVFWIHFREKIKFLLKQNQLVKRISVKEAQEDEEDEIKEMKTLLKSQYDDFDELYLKLEGEKNESEVAELKDKLKSIIRSHTELSHCMYILEDENMFLREQIKGLLT